MSRPGRLTSNVWPAKLHVRLPYYDEILLTDEKVTYSAVTYSLNGCFDPYTGVGGHQPRGFDEYSAMYKRYLVHGCKYVISFSTASDTATTAAAVNIRACTIVGPEHVNAQFTNISDIEEWSQRPDVQIRNISRNSAISSAAANHWTAKAGTPVKGYVSMKKMFQKYRGIDMNSSSQNFIWPQDYSAQFSAVPDSEVYLTMAIQSEPQDNVSLLPAPFTYAQVKLVYYVELYDPIAPASS